MTIITPPENVIAVQTAMGFERVAGLLRNEMPRHGFRVVAELPFEHALDTQIGMVASRYTVFVVWHPFSAYQAVLSDPNGGLMVPFNVALYESDGKTTISVLNQPLLTSGASLGVRVLGQDLNRRMREVLLHLSTYEPTTTSAERADRVSTQSRS